MGFYYSRFVDFHLANNISCVVVLPFAISTTGEPLRDVYDHLENGLWGHSWPYWWQGDRAYFNEVLVWKELQAEPLTDQGIHIR